VINEESLRAVDAAAWSGQFIRPLYKSYCFARLPAFIQSLFGIPAPDGLPTSVLGSNDHTFDSVVLFLADGLGWRFYAPRRERYAALERFARDGVVSKLTSQFPSTTTAHLTTLFTGLPVNQSGLFEWFIYEPQIDAVIAPLLFSYAGDTDRDTLRSAIAPEAIYPDRRLAEDLRSQGIDTFVLQHRSYTPSTFTDTLARSARVLPFDTLPQALEMLLHLLDDQHGRRFVLVYFDRIDFLSHHHGPDAARTDEEIDTMLGVLERMFLSRAVGKYPRTLFAMTADHGHTAVDPATTIYLNQTVPELTDYLRCSAAGRPLVPAGSARDMFLYVKDGAVDDAAALLRQHLHGRADIHTVDALIEQGIFGAGAPSEAFLQRMSDLVVLPYAGESVWWYEPSRFQQLFHGHHGGLTREEMEIPLLLLSLS
jgi:hypothetical protein